MLFTVHLCKKKKSWLVFVIVMMYNVIILFSNSVVEKKKSKNPTYVYETCIILWICILILVFWFQIMIISV